MNENKYDLIYKDSGLLYNTIVLNDPKDIIVPDGMTLREHIPPVFQEVRVNEPIDEAAFIELLESAGGSTPEQIISIYESTTPGIKLFFLKAKAKNRFSPEDPFVITGLDAMEQYIPNGKESIISNWSQQVILDAI